MNKSTVLGYLKDWLRERVQGLEKKSLSRGGKELLLKYVAQALPNYTMNMFLMPKKLCVDMEKIMNKFWWRDQKIAEGYTG